MRFLRLYSFIPFVLLVGCIPKTKYDVPSTEEIERAFASVKCTTPSDVRFIIQNAAKAQHAVMFIHLGWAVMQPQRKQFAKFVHEHELQNPGSRVMFHYVDCTPVTSGYAPLHELDGWEEFDSGPSPIQGWGEIVWMNEGRVLHVERILNYDSVDDLLRKTEELLPAP